MYCSIDIIPEFPIVPMSAVELARMVNAAMLSPEHPPGWLRYLMNYAKHYKIIHDLIESERGCIERVVLKTMNFTEGRNHHVRPAQPPTDEKKFTSERMKLIYCYVKFLRKVLRLDISSYWAKRELLKDKYNSILESSGTNDVALVRVLSQPEFASQVSGKIDLQDSNENGCIKLK